METPVRFPPPSTAKCGSGFGRCSCLSVTRGTQPNVTPYACTGEVKSRRVLLDGDAKRHRRGPAGERPPLPVLDHEPERWLSLSQVVERPVPLDVVGQEHAACPE